MSYIVTWVMEVDEEHEGGPRQAAESCLDLLRSSTSLSLVFEVESTVTDNKLTIDLSEEEVY